MKALPPDQGAQLWQAALAEGQLATTAQNRK
jgi:hypothetical protein